jgi:zinc transport system ATP-binding protein
MEILMDMLDEIRRTYDLSIMMITHDFSMLERYADQVVLMDRHMICQGTPAEVLNSEDFRRVFHRKGGDK